MTLSRIRVSMIDDHPALLRGLAAFFAQDARFEIVSLGGTAEELRQVGLDGSTDVVVADLNMPGSVFDVLTEIVHHKSGARVVVFTAHANAELAIKALDCGAHAFVLKGASSDELFEAVEAASRGEIFVTPAFTSKIFAGMRDTEGSAKDAFATLSNREKQLVELLQQGKTNKEIAVSLELTEKTVKHYMTNLMAKLHVKNRLEVVIASQKKAMGPGL